MSPAFREGDRVRWESQAGGHRTKKSGIIVQEISPDLAPKRVMYRELEIYPYKCNVHSTRNTRSYLVLVDGRVLYWPVASKLRMAQL